ncbi:hypothetical protein PV392_04645 [Streptomyces sp. ME03-5709C]|nr:hypothetical protein [Streptomyces sp. ME03-5709C]
MELVTASVTAREPSAPYDLITRVHGLHHVGDRLGVSTRAADRLRPGGLLVAHLGPAAIRWAGGGPAGRFALAALRAEGFDYSARHHRLTLAGPRTVRLPLRFVGAGPDAGPNDTGRPGVAARYRHADCSAGFRKGAVKPLGPPQDLARPASGTFAPRAAEAHPDRPNP